MRLRGRTIALCSTAITLLVGMYIVLLRSRYKTQQFVKKIPPEFFHGNNLSSAFTNRVYKIDRDLVGYVWPMHKSSGNRMTSQMTYIKEYALIRGDNITNNKRVILRVGDFNFLESGWVDGQGLLRSDNCPITDCWFTSDQSHAKTADALFISEFDSNRLKHYTPKPPHQIWITKHAESPYHNRIDPTVLNNLVNWTVTYRQESTIVAPYGAWEKRNQSTTDKNPNTSQKNYAEGKTKQVAWFVSNCNDRNGRLRYAKKLSDYIQVDIYGACGRFSCHRKNGGCETILRKDYKFYLAFENSNCIDYITEKFYYNALRNDVIPIVMGARPEDYAAAAPTGSFIHVDDFESPRHLADYLKLLDKNNTLYNEYFRFKESWREVPYASTWCRVCALLHLKDDTKYVHWYKDYDKWWNGVCNARNDGGNPWQTWRS